MLGIGQVAKGEGAVRVRLPDVLVIFNLEIIERLVRAFRSGPLQDITPGKAIVQIFSRDRHRPKSVPSRHWKQAHTYLRMNVRRPVGPEGNKSFPPPRKMSPTVVRT